MNDAASTADTPAVHPTYLKLLCIALRNRGVDVDALLSSVALGDWERLAGRASLVEHRIVNSFIQNSLRISGLPSLGLVLGTSMKISAHGPMGYAAMASKDLRQALEAVSRYLPLRNSLLRVRLRETDTGVAFELIEMMDLEESRDFINAVVFATFISLMESITGHVLDNVQVDLPFPEPAWRAEIDSLFKGRLRFGAQRMVFYISNKELALPCITADLPAYEKACMECEQLLSKAKSTGMEQRVKEFLTGREGQYPSLEDAADFFNISSSTLIRKLKKEQTSFQELLDEIRQQRAAWYLTNTTLPVEEIAARLGFEDTSNFSRTFRRWHGATPSALRKNRNPDASD